MGQNWKEQAETDKSASIVEGSKFSRELGESSGDLGLKLIEVTTSMRTSRRWISMWLT